jgi:CBS domain-containing protein
LLLICTINATEEHMRAMDVMTRDVITVGPNTSVSEIAGLFLRRRISGVPVVDSDGKLLGLVSEGDLVRRVETGTDARRSWWLDLLTDSDEQAATYAKTRGKKAEDVMTPNVVTATETTPLRDIAALMERHRIKRVPIVRDGKVVGIVSRANLIQGLASHGNVEKVPSRDDEVIREAILRELNAQPWTSMVTKNIVVTDGIVHLWGFVRSEEERRAIKVAAENTPGVKGVRDHLNIEIAHTAV